MKTAISTLGAIVSMLAGGDASASCRWSWPGETWTAQDKRLHFAAGIGLAGVAGIATRDPWAGFAAGAAFGLAKELADIRGGTCSGKDLVVTALGAAVGAAGSRAVLYLNERGTPIIGYSWELR